MLYACMLQVMERFIAEFGSLTWFTDRDNDDLQVYIVVVARVVLAVSVLSKCLEPIYYSLHNSLIWYSLYSQIKPFVFHVNYLSTETLDRQNRFVVVELINLESKPHRWLVYAILSILV